MSPEGGREYSQPRPRHQSMMASIAKKTGKKVEWVPVSSSIEEIQIMRDGKLHIAGFDTGTTGFAVNLAGFIPLAVKADRDKKNEMSGYRLQIIVNSNSPYHSLYDLQGKVIAHTSSTSNSGNLAPRALLPDFGLIPDSTYQVVYSGKHKKSILGVVDGTYPAAAVASSVLKRMTLYDGTVAAEDIRILYTSPKFPTLSMGYVYNLKPEIVEQIKQVLFAFVPLSKVGKAGLKNTKGYVPVSYKRDWKIIRHIAEFSGYSYTEEGLARMLAKKKK
jgi:phosphonate transport system substrate-binding protein